MTRSIAACGKGLLGATAIAVTMSIAAAAHANLIILPNGNAGGVAATNEPPSNGGPGFPCAGCTTNNVTTLGYTSGAVLQAQDAGLYQFTFEGAGDASDTNRFSSSAVAGGGTGSGSFIAFATGGSGAGSSPLGSTFTEFLNAGETIQFSMTSTPDTGGDPHCSVTAGITSTQVGCDYLIALDSSPSSPGALGPQTRAWIGFSDFTTTTQLPDHDFQDLVVRVDEIPEPATLGLMLTGLLGLARLRRRRPSN